MAWIAAVISAAGGVYGADQANKAGDAQKGAAAKNAQLQRDILGTQLRLAEPQRGLGYGALSDLASLYGYALPAYTPLNSLMSPASGAAGGSSNWDVGQPIDIKGTRGKENRIAGIDQSPWSHSTARLGGTIDPLTGTVTVDSKKTAKQEKYSGLATDYLRGDTDSLKGGKFKRVRSAIDALRDQGYQWTDTPPPQTAGPTGEAGNMSRFFTSPDYQFRRDEGQRDIGNSFAARGGAASGNALRALTEFNSNLASGEFNNYRNSLFNMAGMGQTAGNQAAGAVNNFGVGTSMANTAQGDARASGVMGGANSLMGGLNAGANTWMLGKYIDAMNRDSGTGTGLRWSSPYGPYRSGYQGGSMPQQSSNWTLDYLRGLGYGT